jgi:hypothetical protein
MKFASRFRYCHFTHAARRTPHAARRTRPRRGFPIFGVFKLLESVLSGRRI